MTGERTETSVTYGEGLIRAYQAEAAANIIQMRLEPLGRAAIEEERNLVEAVIEKIGFDPEIDVTSIDEETARKVALASLRARVLSSRSSEAAVTSRKLAGQTRFLIESIVDIGRPITVRALHEGSNAIRLVKGQDEEFVTSMPEVKGKISYFGSSALKLVIMPGLRDRIAHGAYREPFYQVTPVDVATAEPLVDITLDAYWRTEYSYPEAEHSENS